MARNTFKKFKEEIEAKYPGCVLEDDDCVLHLTAPAGHTWDGDLHEYVAQHRAGLEDPRDANWMHDAIVDLKGRVTAPVVCGKPECEWCNPPEDAEGLI